MDLIELYVEEYVNERLDLYLSKKISEVSRTYVSKLIKRGLVKVNNKSVKPRYIVELGDYILIKLPKPKELEIVPENIPLDIIFEDEDILVINKPTNMVVHPAPGNFNNTLVNGIIYHEKNIAKVGEELRPGIVHRLDKKTSGAIVIAKSQIAYERLIKLFKNRKVKRVYYALVYGHLKLKESIINAPIGRHPIDRKRMAVIFENSKEAITEYRVVKEYNDFSLVELRLHTGRTHQIRVHMSYLGHPVVGDTRYTRRKNPFNTSSHLLHAGRLGFNHPVKGEYMEFEAPLPKEFQTIIDLLELKLGR